jgi:hypothetical protein
MTSYFSLWQDKNKFFGKLFQTKYEELLRINRKKRAYFKTPGYRLRKYRIKHPPTLDVNDILLPDIVVPGGLILRQPRKGDRQLTDAEILSFFNQLKEY